MSQNNTRGVSQPCIIPFKNILESRLLPDIDVLVLFPQDQIHEQIFKQFSIILAFFNRFFK